MTLTLSFLKEMTLILKKELDFACQNLSPEIELLSVVICDQQEMEELDVTYTRFTDKSRLKTL